MWCCVHFATSYSSDSNSKTQRSNSSLIDMCPCKSAICLRNVIFILALCLSSVRAIVENDDVLLENNRSSNNPTPITSVETAARRLRCVGWRATSNCTPDGPRKPQSDKNCTDVITGGTSGYCEVEDVDSGTRFQVMRSYCSGLQPTESFRCSEAPYFADFRSKVHAVVEKAISKAANDQNPRNGIVMIVNPKLLVSAYAGIRVLRDVLRCRLPIEVWFHVDEIGEDFALLAPLQQLAVFVGGVSFHPIYNPRAQEFLSKVFAIYNSNFDRVLLLDADNIPARDPTFLFTSLEFEANGAVFWPDYWHPRHPLSNLHAQSLVWELLDTPFVDMFEQESGQVLVDRVRHATPLELVYFYAFHEPNYFQKLNLVNDGKDLFRFAWMKLEAPFHMIDAVPAIAGQSINGSFCGMAMIQHDADGKVLFLHRKHLEVTDERDEWHDKSATEKIVSGSVDIPSSEAEDGGEHLDDYPESITWTHLLSFSKNSIKEKYWVDSYHDIPEFPHIHKCYGHRQVDNVEGFELQEFWEQDFAGIEADIRHYALEYMHKKRR